MRHKKVMPWNASAPYGANKPHRDGSWVVGFKSRTYSSIPGLIDSVGPGSDAVERQRSCNKALHAMLTL